MMTMDDDENGACATRALLDVKKMKGSKPLPKKTPKSVTKD
jgi:hypothetical protein